MTQETALAASVAVRPRPMTTGRFIRTCVFGVSQEKFAEMLHCTQTTVSRAENRAHYPTGFMLKVLALAKQKQIPFEHRWFFEVPEYALSSNEIEPVN